MVACDSVSQNFKLLYFTKRRPVGGALVARLVRTIRGNQNIRNSTAWLEFRAYRQLMQPNLKRFSVCEIHEHSLADVPLIESTRVYRHVGINSLNGRDAFQ